MKDVNIAPGSRTARFANPVMVVKEVTGGVSPGQELYCVTRVSFDQPAKLTLLQSTP